MERIFIFINMDITSTNLLFLAIVGGLVGAASGYLGSFMVLKRMSLVGDSLSHVALPGIAIAIMFGINPMVGALGALALAVAGIWYLAEKSEIYPEALVGVFFTASLAVGLLITPEPELFEALFGDIEKVTRIDGLVIIAASIVLFTVVRLISKKLMLSIISEDLAKSGGVATSKINLIYLLLVGLVIGLGIKFLGTLLTGALVIVPAVAAKNISKSIISFQITSVILGSLSTIVGIFIGKYLGVAASPAIVLVAVGFFILSYFFKR